MKQIPKKKSQVPEEVCSEESQSERSEDEKEEEKEVGPSSHISLLDQHSRLKQEAQGMTIIY